MRYLTLPEVLELHRHVIQQSGGARGVLTMAAFASALAQPRMTCAGEDLYPTLVDKAGALGYALIQNHPFVDGNKRTGHAAMEVFLVLNSHEMRASVDEQEQIIVQVAAGESNRDACTAWLRSHVVKKASGQAEVSPPPADGVGTSDL